MASMVTTVSAENRNHVHLRLLASLARCARFFHRWPPPGPRSAWRSRNPCQEAPFHLFRVHRLKDTVEGTVRRDAARKRQKCFQSLQLVRAILSDLVATLGSAQYRHNSDQKNLFQQMFPVPLYPRVLHPRKLIRGTIHIPFSQHHPVSRIARLVHLYASALGHTPDWLWTGA